MTKQLARRALLCAIASSAIGLSGCVAQADTAQAKIAPLAVAERAVPSAAFPVTLLKTPNGGIQPQAALDAEGTLHLIYFRGEPLAGDIFYIRSTDGASTWSAPLRVNSQPSSAIAMGTIRGAQIAIGKGNSVHVAWNGSQSAEPKGAGGTPMLYARLNSRGTAFEPQRNLVTWAGGLDGGGTIASDATGRIYVAWHAAPEGKDESERAVYLARSTDNGATFEREKRINPQPTGACGCCQMRAFVDDKGTLSILYRAAGGNINRDSTLLVSGDKGNSFKNTMLQPWQIAMCPMSSFALAQGKTGLLAAWETDDQIYLSTVQAATGKFNAPSKAPGQSKASKHPVLAANAAGQVLMAWTENTGWNQGGSLAWQIYGADGQPTELKGRAEGVPVWGSLSAISRPDGGFTLLY